MPRKRRIPHRRRRGAIVDNKDVRHALRTGNAWFGDLFGSRDLYSSEADHEAIEAAWNNLRDVILDDWIAINPGSRPWAWWAFDSTERRKRIGTRRLLMPAAEFNHLTQEPHTEFVADTTEHPFDNRKLQEELRQAAAENTDHYFARHGFDLSFGLPRFSFGGSGSWPEYETELDYLKRLNLLQPGELDRAIGADCEMATIEGAPRVG